MSLAQLLRDAREIRNNLNKRNEMHIKFTGNHADIYSHDHKKIYWPSLTAESFHADNSFVKLVIGPYGSGKSTMCAFEIVKRTCEMPAWYNGRRRAKWAIVRNTSGELHSTTLQTWLTWFHDLGFIRKRQKPLLTYEHTFNDGFGVVELELIFIALDREEDVRKIKSLEVTGCYINELSEVPQAALSHFKGRVNKRYPSKQFCEEDYWSGIIADTNPPDIDHWIYKDFEVKQLESYKIFHQPPGLIKDSDGKWQRNKDADNALNLANDYYLKLAEGQTEDFVKVFCLGQYGSVGFGKQVYPEYNDDLHSVDDIKPIQGDPLYVGWDFGLTPACIVAQISPRGQLMILKEYVVEDMGIRTFAESVVLPGIERDFPYNKITYSVADPSGIKRSEIMEELSCIGELNEIGIKTEAANTNDLDPRIGAVRYFLNRMVDGKPGFIVSRKGCPVLRRGFIKDYCYKRMAIAGEERFRDKPDKNMASHPHDALQYVALKVAGDHIIRDKMANNKMQDMNNPVFRWF